MDDEFPPLPETMVPRELVRFMYNDSDCDCDFTETEDEASEACPTCLCDSDWEGFPTASDLISIATAGHDQRL